MNQLSILVGTSALAVGMAFATSPAQAFTINLGASSTSSNSPATGASTVADFSFTQQGSQVKLTVDIANTTGNPTFGAGATASKLTAFAFDLASGVSVASFSGGTYLDTLISPVSAPPFDNFDVAAADNSNYTGGNANAALPQNTSDQFSFLFNTSLSAAQVEQAFLTGFSNDTLGYAARFQQVNAGAGSDKLTGGTISNGAVPEPLTMLGVGAAASFGAFFKKRLAKANQRNA